MQDVLALHALVTADHIADAVITHVAHVQSARRVGEHAQAIELFLAGILGDLEALIVIPVLLGLGFDLIGAILCVHRLSFLDHKNKREQGDLGEHPGREGDIGYMSLARISQCAGVHMRNLNDKYRRRGRLPGVDVVRAGPWC